MTGERMSAGRIVMVVLIVALGVPLGLGGHGSGWSSWPIG